MNNQALTEAATKQFKTNSPIEARIKITQVIKELQKSGVASGKQQGEKAVDFKLTNGLGHTFNCWIHRRSATKKT